MAWIALLVGLVVGAMGGIYLRRSDLARLRLRRAADHKRLPTSTEHVLDLLRRLHGANAVCLVGRDADPVIATGTPPPPTAPKSLDRAISLARLAMGDGREHVAREGECVVAVGDGRLGAAMVLGKVASGADEIEAVSSELRKLLGDLHVDLRPGLPGASGDHQVQVGLPPGLNTLPAIASGLCDRARVVTGRPTAVVVRNAGTDTASVIAVSHNADRRLLGTVALAQSAVGRACFGEGAITTGSRAELFGGLPQDRRRREEQGIAYPLRDARQGVGALVVFGANEELDAETREKVMWLAVDVGPRFAAAAAVRVAEERAMTDPLTRLPNRAALDKAMAVAPQGSCAVLYVDLDHFKEVNDRLGHAAGDDALKHVADVFRGVLRERDVAARTGGEEFVLWLPVTSRESAMEVAERVRRAVAETSWIWQGSQVGLTCSIGVAAKPDTTRQIDNLMPAADAALYRAKRKGRNRVEEASPAA